jgi:hypothetical protein
MHLRHFLPAIFAINVLAAAPAPNAAQLEAVVKAREQRTTLLRDELKAQDARIEARIEAIVAGLKSITDSKDSRTKVTRLKETTIGALRKNLEYFRQKRAALVEELRRPTWRLTDEQKRRGIEVFDEHIQKRVAQILALEKSFPTEKEYDRYTATGSGWYGTTYEVNEDFKQNQRLTSRTNAQRDELIGALDQSIARLEQQNRTLKTQGAPAAELAKNDALIAERRKQRAEVLLPAPTSARAVGKKEAADLDSSLRKATDELRREFTTLFARYHSLIAELSALNTARAAAAAVR